MDKISQLVDVINVDIFVVDNDFNIKYCNVGVSSIAGKHPDDIVNRKCYSVLFGLSKNCKNCPLLVSKDFTGSKEVMHDAITFEGTRKIFKSSITRLDETLFAEVMTDVSEMSKSLDESTHSMKRVKASNVVLIDEKSKLERHNKFFDNVIDNLSQGIMAASSDYSVIIINSTLRVLSRIGSVGKESLKCYAIYGFNKPCKDCPFNDPTVTRSLRNMDDKHMTVTYSKFDKFVVETLRDTTREIKLIDEIRTNQEEIKEKQRQMFILNADLLRMNEKMKAIQSLIDDELQQVGHIQESLLPEKLPGIEGYDFGSAYIPAEHAGGDYYDCIEMSNNYWGFLVADVSGHGTPAAVIMAITRAIMRSYTFDVVSSSEALGMVNDILCDNIHTKDFVTMFYAVFEMRSGRINLASAGHNPVLVFDKSEFLVKKVSAGGMFLGTFAGLEYEEKKMSLDEGDIFFMYTDGLVEAMNAKREQYGYDRLVSKLMMFSSYTCSRIIEEIMEDVKDFTKGCPFEDDITILAIKKAPKNEAVDAEKA